MTSDFFKAGDWNAVCHECGAKKKASQLRRHWQGYYVCPNHWEPRHPQDFVRARADVQTPPWTQPDPPDEFIAVCTPDGVSAIPALAIPGCMIPGRTFDYGSSIPSFCTMESVISKAGFAAAGCATVGRVS